MSRRSNRDDSSDVPLIVPLRSTIVFDESALELTEGFSCATPGRPETKWEAEVSSWISAPRGKGGAVDAVRHGTKVWLYFKDHAIARENLIGFTSLGVQSIDVDGIPHRRLTIPYFGISTHFRSGRDTSLHERPAWRVFANVLDVAQSKYSKKHTHVFLEVDPDNPARTRFYPFFDFAEVDQYQDAEGFTWVVMAMRMK